mgnify:CR=1 FL=1
MTCCQYHANTFVFILLMNITINFIYNYTFHFIVFYNKINHFGIKMYFAAIV